jgi:hypothetical protein
MPLEVDGIGLNPLSSEPATSDGEIWYSSPLSEPRVRRLGTNETLLTPTSHRALDDLTHAIAESGVTEDAFDAEGCLLSRTIRTAASPAGVAIRTWDSYTFDADGCLTGYRVRQFTAIGGVAQTLTVSRPGGVWTTVLS